METKTDIVLKIKDTFRTEVPIGRMPMKTSEFYKVSYTGKTGWVSQFDTDRVNR
jgi:hypothetical protein